MDESLDEICRGFGLVGLLRDQFEHNSLDCSGSKLIGKGPGGLRYILMKGISKICFTFIFFGEQSVFITELPSALHCADPHPKSVMTSQLASAVLGTMQSNGKISNKHRLFTENDTSTPYFRDSLDENVAQTSWPLPYPFCATTIK